MSNGVTPAQFIAKWSPVELSEPAASQEHLNDLCRLLGQPKPTDYDPSGGPGLASASPHRRAYGHRPATKHATNGLMSSKSTWPSWLQSAFSDLQPG